MTCSLQRNKIYDHQSNQKINGSPKQRAEGNTQKKLNFSDFRELLCSVPFKQAKFPVLGAYYLIIDRTQGQTLLLDGMCLDRSVGCLVDLCLWVADTVMQAISVCTHIGLILKP